MAKTRSSKLNDEMGSEDCFKLKNELTEIEAFMSLSISLIQDEDTTLN